jgi:hypothetical protein
MPERLWRSILVLGPVLVLALAFSLLWEVQVTAERPDDDDLSVRTDRVAQLADAYITRVVGVTSHLAIAPDVVGLAEKSAARSATGKDAETQARWSTTANVAGDPFFDIQKQPVSQFFADVKAADSAYREIFLADREGRLLAASNRTEDFQQKDDPWWPKKEDFDRFTDACRRLPMSCVSLSRIEWDASAGVFGFDVVLPVVTPGGHTVGVLKAVVDPSELEALIRFAALSQGLDVALVNPAGARVFSREPFFNPMAVPPIRDLRPGNEGSWPLAGSRKNGPVAFVRKLRSPVPGGWFVAIADRDSHRDGRWKPYALWCLFTLGMFLIAAGAFAVRVPGRAEAPEEREAAA